MYRFSLLLLYIIALCPAKATGQTLVNHAAKPYSAYLFVYFTGNSKPEEAIRFAISQDGYRFRALNKNLAVINSSEISETGGVRDPHILRGSDGNTFYMVATDMVSANGWNSNRGIVMLKSKDLIHWTSSKVNIQKKFEGQENLQRVWAPQTIFDEAVGKYMIYFSMKHGKDPDKIYYAYANQDFTDLDSEPKQLFYSAGNAACIDGDIIKRNGQYYLFFKTEDGHPGIKIAVSDSLTSGYRLQNDRYVQQTESPVEGSGTFRLNNGDGYILMYDMYMSGRYQFTRSSDLQTFKVVDKKVSMDFHPRHGTVLPVTAKESEQLLRKWMTPHEMISAVEGKGLRENNLVIDTAKHELLLPVAPDISLKNFKPMFLPLPGVTIKPSSNSNFGSGTVDYQIRLGRSKPVHYTLRAVMNHNPVIPGYYADPEILYAEQTGRFYLYPTSDGFTGWSGTYFKAFSSADLVNWRDEGIILDLSKDVAWAKRNAWAPCITEKKIAGHYKYFYYYSAAQKIGVAVSDSPTGPFTDSGKPLVDARPAGISAGQQIDPDVFTDPSTGKSYLYWGNGYLAGAELNEDMISIKTGTTTILTPDSTFREAGYVFYRNGKYYFTWSEDDTRSVNYQVRYGISSGPLSEIKVPKVNLVISKVVSEGIYATGHNSVLKIPGRDEWYLVYHRFSYPIGITMGKAAGYHREICIDRMRFDPDGKIYPVVPTHSGILAIKLPKRNIKNSHQNSK